jgi:site-specific DNA recombinase
MSNIKSKTSKRFAALVRVSTEEQEKTGESLRTQRKQIEAAVTALGGTVSKWYEGQEHATAGHERRLFDTLLADAGKTPRPFDAVMVADPTRWSRDNVRSEQGLDTLRDAGVGFYVLTSEYSLYDPTQRLFLGLSSTIGAYHARVQKQKSLLNRIERARRGIPTAGGVLPFGRKYRKDGEKGEWVVIEEKRAMIEDVARRYLAGEQLPRLATEYGVNRSHLAKTLREGCGDRWVIEFKAPDLNIDETVEMKVPPLLDKGTIKAVRGKLEANRTYLHKPPRPVHKYLLSGYVFCGVCGYSLFGATNYPERRYYKHAHHDNERSRACPLRPRPFVPADEIEREVVSALFGMFGSPAAIERAVKAAAPDCEKLLKERRRLEGELGKVTRGRDRIVGLIVRDSLTDEQAEEQLAELKEREEALREQLERLGEQLVSVAAVGDLQAYVWRPNGEVCPVEEYRGGDGYFQLQDAEGEQLNGGNDLGTLLGMSWEDKRRLVEGVFGGAPMPDGKPAGVYVRQDGKGVAHRPKNWIYTIRGHLDFESVVGLGQGARTVSGAERSADCCRRPFSLSPCLLVSLSISDWPAGST